MAFKGPAYVKTAWNFEERPVASAKLNTWDDRIEAALELVCLLLNLAWGGGNGVLRGATADDLKTVAKATPGLSVEVKPGWAFINKFPFKIAATVETPEVTPPETNNRIDLVQASLPSWSITIKQGSEAASPSPPNPDTDCIALAHLYLRPGMTVIKNADDSSNGYIIDVRAFL
ncbi:MAG TPA: hypothetical protein PKI11_02360 [Candidatus Hydrogenedentes bacterium]|nr:hypothetical protein [Candidatus Hydrogenedentota bacterium]